MSPDVPIFADKTNNIYETTSEQYNKVKNDFNAKIQERKIMSKKISKYIATFNSFDKTLIGSSATSGGISIFLLQMLLELLE